MQVKPILKTVAIVVVVFFAIWLIFQLLFGAAESAAYAHVFRVVTTEGGVNAWLARVVAVLFAVGVAYGLPRVFSIKKQRRTLGWGILGGTFVAFNLLMYVCTRSITGVDDEQIFTEHGPAKAWFYEDLDRDQWELFPRPGVHPKYGVALKPMTPEHAKRYDAWKRKKAEQSEHQQRAESERRAAHDKAEGERQFHDTYVNEGVLKSGATLLVAIKVEGPDSSGDSLQGQIANLFAKKNENPAFGAFKPAFYTGGLFDALWNGDQSAVERLKLLERSSRRLLLARATFSQPEKTSFDGIVSVQGTLAFVMLTQSGRNAPSTFNASGAGANATMATQACAKRLADAVDIGVVLQK